MSAVYIQASTKRSTDHRGRTINTVFARVIYAHFFFILAAEKSGCVKYADFLMEFLIWVLF